MEAIVATHPLTSDIGAKIVTFAETAEAAEHLG